MKKGAKDEKSCVDHREGSFGELKRCDVEEIDKENERKNINDKQLVVTRSQARWLRIGERLGLWLRSLVKSNK